MDATAQTAILLGDELDMLHSIFEFLPLGALGQAARACAHWRVECWAVTPRDATHHDEGVCIRAAYIGSPASTLDYLHSRGCPWCPMTLDVAAAAGRLSLVQYLVEHGCPQGPDVICAAASGGCIDAMASSHWELSQCCLEHRRPLAPLGLLGPLGPDMPVAAGGHIEVVQDLRAQGHPWDAKTLGTAATAGHLALVQYLVEHECPWPMDIVAAAATSDSHEVVRYVLHEVLRRIHLGLDLRHLDRHAPAYYAAIGGHLEALQALHAAGWVRTGQYILETATRHGHLPVVQFLHEHTDVNMDPQKSRAITYAAECGNLEMVKYLHKNGYAWCSYTSQAAAKGGNLEVVKYIRAYGCPWDLIGTRRAASEAGHDEILRWLCSTRYSDGPNF